MTDMTDFEAQCLVALLEAYGPTRVIGYAADWCSDNERDSDADAIEEAIRKINQNTQEKIP